MPHKHNDIKHGVDPEQIRRYLAGELDDKAMHILERQALEDPFLAEALDGYSGYAPDQTANLEDLDRLLEKRVAPAEKRRGIVYFRWAAAAAVLILAGIGTMLVLQTPMKREMASDYVKKDSVVVPPGAVTDESGQSLAARADKEPVIPKWRNAAPVLKKSNSADNVIEPPPATDEAVASASAPTPNILAIPPAPLKEQADKDVLVTREIQPKVANPFTKEKKLAQDSRYVEESRSSRDSLNRFYAAKPALDPSLTGSVMPSRSYAPTAQNVTPLQGALSGKAAGIRITSRKPDRMVRLQGQVTSQSDNSALLGVTVMVPGTNKATVTDKDGRFSLLVDSTANLQLDVAYVGYERKKLLIGSNKEDLKIAMAESSTSLNEVVVVGYGTQSKRSLSYSTTTVESDELTMPDTEPRPKRGFRRYKRYLAKHVQYPASADGVQGTVTLSFTVKADGKLADFEVTKELQPDCDTEAIRVVKEGPGWRPASNGKDKKVTVEVRFAPKKP